MSPKARPKHRRSIRLNGRLISQRFSRKEDADAWYFSMLRSKERARAGLELPFQPIRIEQFCADFILGRQHLQTWELDATRLRRYLLPVFGPTLDDAGNVMAPGRELHTITRKEWKAWLDALVSKHGLSPGTCNNIRVLIHRIYEEAKEDEPPRVQSNPISTIKPRVPGEKEIEIFETRKQMQRYLAAMQTVDLSAWMAAMIALNTGMREGEIAALDEGDVSLSARKVRVHKTWSHSKRKVLPHTKTKDQRTIGINESLAKAIAHYRKLMGKREASAPFLILPDGRRMPGDSILTRHKAALEQAKLKYVTFHATRHTFATHFLEAGGSIWDLKNILGHRSVTTTERYAHRLTRVMKSRAGVFQVGTPEAIPVPAMGGEDDA